VIPSRSKIPTQNSVSKIRIPMQKHIVFSLTNEVGSKCRSTEEGDSEESDFREVLRTNERLTNEVMTVI
jgi:hypothetical protein